MRPPYQSRFPLNEWELVKLQKAPDIHKKYEAVLQNKNTGVIGYLPFGSSSHGQYKDSSGLGLWSHLDHNDPKKRERFYHRFRSKIAPDAWTASGLSAVFLW